MNTNIDVFEINTVIDGIPIGIDIPNAATFKSTHFHPYYEIHFIIAGQYNINIKDETIADNIDNIIVVYAGDIIIIPPKIPHSITPADNAAVYERTAFWFDIGKLTNKSKKSFVLSTLSSVRDITIINKNIVLVNRIKTVKPEIENKKPGYVEFIRNEVVNIMILLCRHINETFTQTTSGQYNKKNIVLTIKNYINANYGGECTLKKLAEYLHISDKHLNQLVQKFYSRSFTRLLLETRMSMANYLIKENDGMSFREIAEKTGYTSISAFYHAYNKFYGFNPTEYKKRVKGNSENI